MFSHNIHNHTTYSDGIYAPEELIRYAYRAGLEVFGITDHFGTTKVRSVSEEQLNEYTKHLTRLKYEWRSKLRVLTGIELDSNPARTTLDKLNFSKLNKLDFILVEYVEDPLWGGISFDDFKTLADKLTKPVGLAHPDIKLCFNDFEPEEVISELESRSIFIELSSGVQNTRNGKEYYHLALDFFKKLKDTNVPLAIGTDTHENARDIADIYDANEFIRKLGLSKNVERFLELVDLKGI